MLYVRNRPYACILCYNLQTVATVEHRGSRRYNRLWYVAVNHSTNHAYS